MTTMPHLSQLTHRPNCPAERIEQPHLERPDIIRCVDCASQYPPEPTNVGPLAGMGADAIRISMEPAR